MHTWFYLGKNGEGGVKTEGDGGRNHLLGAEAETGNFRKVWQENGGVLHSTACGEYPREDFVSEPGGGHQGMG